MIITLLKNFTFAADNGGSFTSEWVRIPEEFQNWQLQVQVHGRISSTAGSAQLQTSWDSAAATNIGVAANLATLGLNPQNINSGMGPMARVVLASSADSVVTVSIYLTPKSQ